MVIQYSPSRSSGFSRYEDATDDQLLSLMHLGDDRALEYIMRRYRGIVWSVVKRYLGSLNDAEDIFQDITLLLHRNKESYKTGSAKFSSWLYRVTVNKCLDSLKSSRHKAMHLELTDTIPDHIPNAEDEIEKSQIVIQIQEMLSLLPTQQRKALALYYYENMEVAEISHELSLSEMAIRSLLKRGKAKLRDLSASGDPVL